MRPKTGRADLTRLDDNSTILIAKNMVSKRKFYFGHAISDAHLANVSLEGKQPEDFMARPKRYKSSLLYSIKTCRNGLLVNTGPSRLQLAIAPLHKVDPVDRRSIST